MSLEGWLIEKEEEKKESYKICDVKLMPFDVKPSYVIFDNTIVSQGLGTVIKNAINNKTMPPLK